MAARCVTMAAGTRANTPAVIFDLDGTLADTLDDITDSMNAAFARLHQKTVTPERIRALIGHGLKDLLRKASGIDDPQRIGALVERYREVYRKRMLDRTRPFAGVAEMLDRLAERRIPMAVLSNKPDEFTVPICEALLARWPFVRFRGARDGKPRKPDPAVALELADEIGRAAAEIYFVGDSPTDVLTAKSAGMAAVAVTWGYRDRDELAAADPTHLIDAPRALVNLLTGR